MKMDKAVSVSARLTLYPEHISTKSTLRTAETQGHARGSFEPGFVIRGIGMRGMCQERRQLAFVAFVEHIEAINAKAFLHALLEN